MQSNGISGRAKSEPSRKHRGKVNAPFHGKDQSFYFAHQVRTRFTGASLATGGTWGRCMFPVDEYTVTKRLNMQQSHCMMGLQWHQDLSS
ncbi:hypothetical protein TNCV_4972701 [Trichonephila clavipes]|nr:hypothetical protein TNCV_4972701 [Trichonephila clavipes]